MKNIYQQFRQEFLELVIKPKFQMLANQGNFSNQKDFFDTFRTIHECTCSNTTLKNLMEETGFELVDCTEVINKNPDKYAVPQPRALPLGEDGFDNETQVDWAGGNSGTRIGSG